MRIHITGATGFIGGRIAERLVRSGSYEIICTGREQPQSLQRVEAVIHCAGKAGNWGPYEEYREANVLFTERLLQASRLAGVRRFINLSSPSIYFDFQDQFELKEGDLPARFSNAYARTKYEAEQLVQAAHAPGRFETVSLRPRLVIGAGDRNVLPRLIRLSRQGRLFRVGNGHNRVDVTTVSNLVDAVELCLNAPEDRMGEVYNISNGAPVVFWDFVGEVLKAAGESPPLRHVPRWLLMNVARINEWRCRLFNQKTEPSLLPLNVAVLSQSMTLSIEKAKSRLGYQPKASTTDGIKEFLDWWRSSGLRS